MLFRNCDIIILRVKEINMNGSEKQVAFAEEMRTLTVNNLNDENHWSNIDLSGGR